MKPQSHNEFELRPEFKSYQSDAVRISISLFEKRANHLAFDKENKAKEKFDKKFKRP